MNDFIDIFYFTANANLFLLMRLIPSKTALPQFGNIFAPIFILQFGQAETDTVEKQTVKVNVVTVKQLQFDCPVSQLSYFIIEYKTSKTSTDF